MSNNPKHYRIAIIGSGPAAYAAAAYTENAVLFEGSFLSLIGPGGQLTTTTDVDNYPGFVNGTNGPALMQRMRDSCKADIVEDQIVKISKKNQVFELYTDDYATFLKNTPKNVHESENASRIQTTNSQKKPSAEINHISTDHSLNSVQKCDSFHSKTLEDKRELDLVSLPNNLQPEGRELTKNQSKPLLTTTIPFKDLKHLVYDSVDLKSTINAHIDSKESQIQNDRIEEPLINGENNTELLDLCFSDNIDPSKLENTLNKCKSNNEQLKALLEPPTPRLYTADVLIVATGATARRLYVPGTADNEFWQKGISTCAICDGYAYINRKVIVIGGGDSAMEEALYLANIAREVVLVHRSENFRARVDMLQKVQKNPKITIKTNLVLIRAYGENALKGCIFQGEKEIDIKTDGLFFAIGHTPNTGFLKDSSKNQFLVKLDDDGYIITDHNQNTSTERILAAGDVQDKVYRQAITAAASGARAGITAMKIINNINL